MKFFRNLSVLSLCLSLFVCGCSSKSSTYSIENVNSPSVSMVALGYDAQLADELTAVTNDFQIPYPDAAYAFERGRLFFNRFGGGVALSMRGKNESILGARKSIAGYKYSLTRRDTASGAWFSVSCQKLDPTTNSMEADGQGFRCKNFARFVKSGIIEDKLVTEPLPES